MLETRARFQRSNVGDTCSRRDRFSRRFRCSRIRRSRPPCRRAKTDRAFALPAITFNVITNNNRKKITPTCRLTVDRAPLDIAGGRAVLSMLIDKHSFTGFDPVSSWNGAASSISMLEIATLSGSQFPAKTPRKLLERVRSALTMGPYVFRRP